jgi:hypothetical protein
LTLEHQYQHEVTMATRINLDGVESPGEAGVVEEADEPLAEEGNGVVMLDTFFLCRDGDGDGDGGPLISDNVSGASKHYYMKHAAKYQQTLTSNSTRSIVSRKQQLLGSTIEIVTRQRQASGFVAAVGV